MKEKIELIVLIVVFVVALVFANNMLKDKEIPIDTSNIENTNVEENIETTVIDSKNNLLNEKTVLNSQENVIVNEVIDNTIDNMTNNTVDNTNKAGKVIEVTESTFDKEVLKSDKTVLIDFYADWCNPCKILSPIVEEVAKENPDLKVVKIDVDANENLAYKYGANYIPLLVVIEDGKEVDRAVGAIPKSDILDLIK